MFVRINEPTAQRVRKASQTIIYASAEFLNHIFSRGVRAIRLIDQIYHMPSKNLRTLHNDISPVEYIKLNISLHTNNVSIHNGSRYLSDTRIRRGENLSGMDPYLFSINR